MVLQVREQLAVEAGSAVGHATTKGQLDTGVADAKNRANHLGTQAAATISDFQTAVETIITTFLELGATPATLDTLNELAAALGDDPNYATTIAGQIGALDGRIDAVEAAPAGLRSLSALVGDGVLSTFNVDHGWALADKNKVRVEVVDTVDGATVLCSVVRSTVNQVVVSFGTHIPAANQYRVLLAEVSG